MEQQRLLLDTDEHDRVAEEDPSLYHILKSMKRQEARMVYRICESQGNMQTKTFDILRNFTECMRMKYDYSQVKEDRVERMENAMHKRLHHAANTVLDAPVIMKDIHIAVRNGKPLKAPGSDGICQEFFKLTWEMT